MSIFSRIRDSFRKATSSNVAAADRNTSRNRDNPRTATGRVTQNLLSDIALSFGNTEGVTQAGIDDYNKRTEASKQALKDMQDRNKANRDRDSGSSAPAATTTTTTTATAEPEPDPVIEDITPDTSIITDPPAKLADTPVDTEPLEDPDNPGSKEGEDAPTEPDTGAGTTTAIGAEEEADELEKVAKGETEKKVADTIRGTGRRSTIRTTPRGLLNTDNSSSLRSRRSLMGGGLLT